MAKQLLLIEYVRTKKKVRPHNHRHLFIQNLGMPNQMGEGRGSLIVILKPNFPTKLPLALQKKIKKLKVNKIKKIKILETDEVSWKEGIIIA